MSLEQPWTCFGLPLNINRITLQRGFALFLFYTFFNYEEYRLHVFVLGAVTLFRFFPSFSEAKKDQKRLVKKGPTNAFQAGWRWFPVPAPKTKSHNMRWYPPTSVALEMKAANVEGVTFKKCTHLDIEFVTSPMIVKYYKSCGVELTDVDTGKAKKK